MNSKNFLNITVTNHEDEPIATIDIDGVIGESYLSDDDNTKQNIKSKLQEISDLDVEKIIVNISSLGGSVDHGLAIHDLLASHDAHVETRIIGMTASAGTIIAQAGDTRVISDNALYLIHLARVYAFVNSYSLRNLSNDLEKIDDRIANIYAKASGKSKESFLELMDENNGDGIWLSSDEAKEYGLVDEISEPLKKVACDRSAFNQLGIPIPENMKDEDSTDSKIIGNLSVNIDTSDLQKFINELNEIIEKDDQGEKEPVNNSEQETEEQAEEKDYSQTRERELYLIQNR